MGSMWVCGSGSRRSFAPTRLCGPSAIQGKQPSPSPALLGAGESPQALFSLAMTSRRLHRDTEARSCYERAVARLRVLGKWNITENTRLMREAALVLGIPLAL